MSSRLVVCGFGIEWHREGLMRAVFEADYQIVYWLGCSKDNEAYSKKTFPDFIPESSINEFTICDSDEASLIEVKNIFSPYMEELWNSYLKNFRSSKLRMAGIDARTDFFRKLAISYSIVRNANPDAVVYSTVPTGFRGYSIYICARHFGIKTILLKRILFPGHYNMSHLVEDVENESAFVRQSFENAKTDLAFRSCLKAPGWLAAHFEGLRGATSAADSYPVYFVLRNRINAESQELEDYRINWVGAIRNSFIRKRTGLNRFGGKDNVRQAIHRRRLIGNYDSLCHTIDLRRKYIYAPLQTQPEASTMPNGGIFAYQLLMIDLLSKSLPDDWVIYVRDHPTQLYFKYPNDLYRTTAFYEQISCYPNVQLVSARAPNIELARNALAVATITGYTGWEAINWGVPVLLFGAAWYAGCDGVISVKNVQEIKAAFAVIEEGYRPNLDHIELFSKVILHNAIYGEYRSKFQKSDPSLETSSAQLYEKLVESLVRIRTPDHTAAKEG